ncbi:MAG: type II toxin-antitoxin system HicB family antitoxin [Intestinibacter sp.]|uniref:type II toxin-antitoxin system HicB family antitoxin n=1 Tax=Intestinibacter sp. TaxID=1965304 RepID=UPI0025C70324|nr:type II toxin-antitoxin system HicB family antitoxin [Intestinibacter sp.]MCI6738626.1 type II toxin-antitoxin system HicB family antitoxin [Intestinibacter sp.]
MYKDEYIFYGYFTKHSDDDFEVSFYDFDNIITCGETLEEAFNMAEDALKLELFDLYSDNKEIPKATFPDIPPKASQIPFVVKINLRETIKQYDNKAVKKTLTIPSWLNTEAERNNINFSQVLQEALKQKLNISK